MACLYILIVLCESGLDTADQMISYLELNQNSNASH